jgi:hypothetical protein
MHGGKHTKIYDEYFGTTCRRDRVCELFGTPNADIAHIEASGMGGRESAHTIENLMALCPAAHLVTEGGYKDWLKEKHLEFMEDRTPAYEKGWDDTLLEIHTLMKKNRRW